MAASAQPLYCIASLCMPFADWKDWISAAGTLVAMAIGIIGLRKIFLETGRLKEQKQKEIDERERAALLKRTEFFLGQHRRLFDTPDLFEVLCLIDGIDSPKLAMPEMWDKKRKFLTFLEEMALLVNNRMLDEHVADYMFSYYAKTAWDNEHFRVGINPSPDHWGLLFHYIGQSAVRRGGHECPRPEHLRL